MGEIEDAIERADREAFTRQPPKTLQARINFLMRRLKTTKAVAAELGVTSGRWSATARANGRPRRRTSRAKIDTAVRSRWQPLVRKRRRKQAAAATGITVETRARFGYTAPVGTTDDGRMRRLTVHLPPAYAQRLFDARDAGAGDQEMRQIIAEGLKDVYFQDGGSCATGLSDVEFSDTDYLDPDF
ncbi:telomere-protecting terminal protein Tpg [Streptomyces sp. NBC_01233]|uniref:telomere-protecting terminal protein Tpg n=1 Tax=Streptomyces sp. NBC_01233 TaxID=2903787 RepID=UPI002E13C018|nr:XRE family transcriptional regulator [Streptomyces sp. NBC_01233]